MQVDPRIVKGLEDIAPLVKTEDIMEGALELGVHYMTIHRYLNGKVKKEKFATDLLKFLKSKVENRKRIQNEFAIDNKEA